MFILIGFLLATVVVVGLIFFLRWFAGKENPTIITFVPAQTHALVTTKGVSSDEVRKNPNKIEEQGNVVDVVHAIPGKWFDKSASNPFDWCYKKEDDEHKEPRGLLYLLFGIVVVGFFRYLRLNLVRTFRWGRKSAEEKYHMQAKDSLTRFSFFSGQHDVQLQDVETSDLLGVNLRLQLLYEEKYPFRVRLKTADPYAVISDRASKSAIGLIGAHGAKAIVLDKKLQDELALRVKEVIGKEVEDDLGVEITTATLADVDYNEETKELLEKKAKAEFEAEANLITAKNEAAQAIERADGQMKAQKLLNEGAADRVTTVIKPIVAMGELGVEVRKAEAYENNQTMTTLVIGQGASPVIPIGK
ncbi:MAG: SPFH domain-containing protein [Patescibacteria group bacterium]